MSTRTPLVKLPEQLKALTDKIPVAGRLVTALSVDRWTLPPGRAEVNYLNAARIGLRLFFAKTGSTTVFFIFRKKSETWVMLEALVTLELHSAPVSEPTPVLSVEEITRLVTIPAFMWVDLTEADAAKFGPPGATPLNTVFFRLGAEGKDVFAVKSPETGKKATLLYSPGGVPGEVEPKGGKYSLRPFLEMVRTLRDWIAQEKPAFETYKGVGLPTEDTPVHEILTRLLQAYVVSHNSLKPDAAPPPLRQSYRIAGYGATLKMRLKADGTLAQKKEEEQFQLAVEMKLTTGETPTASVTLAPPDFLIAGPLYDAFFSELEAPAGYEAIARAGNIPVSEVRKFLAAARPGSAIFRVSRGSDSDTDILVLTGGTLSGGPATLIVEAEFAVNVKDGPPTVRLKNRPRVTKLEGDAASFKTDYDGAEYFLRLARGMWLWVQTLGRW
ncbi:MAG TPA: hypothetical protein VF297_02360 [Pyrinomonadaceae bacterium]